MAKFELLLSFSGSRFDAVIISSEVGYEKPDEKIFRAALGSALKLLPIDVIYDTSLVHNSPSDVHSL